MTSTIPSPRELDRPGTLTLAEVAARQLPKLLPLPSHRQFVAVRAGSREHVVAWLRYNRDWRTVNDDPATAKVWAAALAVTEDPESPEVTVERRPGVVHGIPVKAKRPVRHLAKHRP